MRQNRRERILFVKSDICGGIGNQSRSSSHKRLSDGKRELPEDREREVLDRLAGNAHKLGGRDQP